MLQSVASGLLGRSAYAGGLPTAALGLGLHFFIAFVAAAVYFGASVKWPLLVRRAAPCGLVHGIAVFFFMRHVVLPLSAFQPGPFSWPLFVNGLLIHAFGVGLPIALVARRSARRRSRLVEERP